MLIPDCYDPVNQAERLEAAADEGALVCESCGQFIRGDFWDIENACLCEKCAQWMYLRKVVD